MVDFFYDNFYEVLSGEGLWVLILIGCALAVASFILLTMKIEVNPKQNHHMNTVVKTIEKEESIPQKKDKKKKKKIKIGGMFKGAEKDAEGAEQLLKSRVVMPVRPEIAQMEQTEQMEQVEQVEQVNVEMTDPDGFDIPALPEMEDEPSPLNDAAMPMDSMEAEDSIETYDGENADTVTEDNTETEESSTDTEKSEEETGEEGETEKDSSSIFDIFSEVEDEESSIAEIAKNMEDVTINGLLSDTETLSEELKNIFSKYRRA